MDKFVIYFAGGTMRGVFGAGVATAFSKSNAYTQIKAVYTASAGSFTGAYFLSRQYDLGSSIYFEELRENFISQKNFFIGTWQRFQNKFIRKVPTDEMLDALDIDYVIDVVKNKKPLNVEEILGQEIPLYVKLFDLDAHKIDYLDANNSNIFEILRAGINVFPYMHKPSVINNKNYIDGAIMDIIGFDSLRAKYPDEKIIIVMNGQTDRKWQYRAKNILEGKFMQWMFNDKKLYELYASAETRLAEDLEKIKSDKNCWLITPEKDVRVRSRTTNIKPLLEMYNLGLQAGEKAVKDLF